MIPPPIWHSRRGFIKSAAVAPLLCAPSHARASAHLRLHSDFAGGSARVLEIDQINRTFRIAPDTHPDRGFVAWWYFKLEGLEIGEIISFDVDVSGWGLPERAHVSTDNSAWRHTAPGERLSRTLGRYQHRAEAETLWFAWGPPFLLRDAQDLIARACSSRPYARPFDLGPSREGRPVPALMIAQGAGAERTVIWVQARQHAWECGSSWVARGLVEWLLSDDAEAEALRKRADIVIVPIMDIDSVERGDGGKNQIPHDHNFDWGSLPQHYPEVRAAMDRLTRLEQAGRLDAFIDLHNPGAGARNVFFYVPAQPLLTPARLKVQDAFLKRARATFIGPMAFTGELGPIGAGYDPAIDRTSESWVAAHARADVVALTLETPWNTPTSTTDGYRETGANLGRCLHRFRS